MRITNIAIKSVMLVPVFVTALFTSCSETDYMTYDTSYSGIYFTNDTLKYSFSVTPTQVRKKEYRIPVALMGKPSGENRVFTFETIAEKTTAQDGEQYTIGTPIIEADSINGYIPVYINRDKLEGNSQDGYIRYKLTIKLLPDAVFTPTLADADRTCVLMFDNAVEQPEWLDPDGDKVWYESQWGVWHPLKLIKMVEYFHQLESILPDTYKKMAELYGENLENVPYADFFQYRTVMRRYVYKPMYDYFSASENYDEIIGLYPDFPFDFPNPYA